MISYVYILASRKHGTLYIGHTADLARRIFEHQTGAIEGFTKTYGITRLVHVETFDHITRAQHRETQLKKWKRAWKIQLIEKENPDWQDLTHLLAP